MLSIEDIQKALREEDLKVLKGLGQNFLIDEGALQGIISAAEISPSDTVVEVGPGLGVLTFELSKRAGRVIAIEKDRKMSAYLRRETEKRLGAENNIEIINDDILKVNIPQLLKERGIKDYKLVANIPYYITSSILRLFLETEKKPASIVVLIQKEVAERVCAGMGDMSILALSVLLYGRAEIVRQVPSGSFYPAPKVDSAVLIVRGIGKRFPDADYKRVFGLIKIGFSSKRKKLVNNLAAGMGIPKDQAAELLAGIGVGPDVRAQDLSVEDWVRLSGV